MKKIMLSFDVEEFDLPREFNENINENDMYKISHDGCVNLLNNLNIKATFFVTANFARKYPDLIKKISEKHEIGLHGDEHKDNYKNMTEKEFETKIMKAKKNVERIISAKIQGFRAPRLMIDDDKYKILKNLGFEYDSSYIPSFVPGRYNNFFGKRNIFFKSELKVIPLSVIPIIRMPMTWYVFRNLGLLYGKFGTVLNKNVCLVFHSWEFFDLSNFNIWWIIKRNTGEKMTNLLKNYVEWGKKNYEFVTMGEIK